jgi:hypothetical protein
MFTKRTESKRDHRQEPTYWFAVMEIARERGDLDGAAEAKRQLQRLGVSVSYNRPQRAGSDRNG